MDSLTIAVAGAMAGAAAGSVGTWMVSALRDQERDSKAANRAIVEKVHQLELRMVKVETDLGFYVNLGSRRAQEGMDAQQT